MAKVRPLADDNNRLAGDTDGKNRLYRDAGAHVTRSPAKLLKGPEVKMADQLTGNATAESMTRTESYDFRFSRIDDNSTRPTPNSTHFSTSAHRSSASPNPITMTTDFSEFHHQVSSPMISSDLPRLTHTEIWTPEVVQRVSILALLMTVTLTGNVAVIATLTCGANRKWLTSRVNLFIVNLAVGDLTVCFFTMTTEVLFVTFERGWVLGAVACRVLLYIQIVTLASITFILTAMSFDRYLAICRPICTLAPHNDRRRRLMLVLSWSMALILATPQLFIFKQVPVGIYLDGTIKYQCASRGYTAWWQRKTYFTFLASYILVVPAILMTFCYVNIVRVVWERSREVCVGAVPGSITSEGRPREGTLRKSLRNPRALPRAKIRTVQMTLSIICTFVVCWTPYFVVHLVHIWSEYTHFIPEAVYVVAENLALVNSAVNPFLYAWFSAHLKQRLYAVFCPQTRGAGARPQHGRPSETPTFSRTTLRQREEIQFLNLRPASVQWDLGQNANCSAAGDAQKNSSVDWRGRRMNHSHPVSTEFWRNG